MLSMLKLKRTEPLDHIESVDQDAVAIAPAAEESCPAPDTRPSRDPSLRAEPRFMASDFTPSDFTAERIVPQADAKRLVSRLDTEHLTPRSDPMFPPTTFPTAANDSGTVEDHPSIDLGNEPSALGKALKRSVTGLVIMIGGAIATMGWQNFSDDAKQVAERLASQVPLVSWLHLKHQNAAQTVGAPSADATAASAQAPQETTQANDAPQADASQQAATPPANEQAAPQQAAAPEPAAPASTLSTTAPVAAPSPDVTQLTQSVQALTREVASLQKGMAEMKANHEQMAREFAKLNERNAARRAAIAPRPATPTTPQVQRPASLPPVQSATTPRPVSQYQPPARAYPASSQEALAAPPHALAPPPSAPPPVYSQSPASQPPVYSRSPAYSESSYPDSVPAPRPPASVP